MNKERPFLKRYLCDMKLAIHAPNDFLTTGFHQKSEVDETKHSPKAKYISLIMMEISLFWKM
jgi:hypothetical protein